jgi:hypothetical protein
VADALGSHDAVNYVERGKNRMAPMVFFATATTFVFLPFKDKKSEIRENVSRFI